MRRATLSPALAAVLAAATMSGLGQAAQAAQAAPAARTAAAARPAFYGREVFKIVTVRLGERRSAASASGAFTATGTFVRGRGTFYFPKGRIHVRRRVTSTRHSGPDLVTCRFTIWQNGTFTVLWATGSYRGLRDSGSYHSTLHGKYNRTGPDRCGYKLVYYHVVTYEQGFAR
jgi:hypothetical protein